CPRSSSYAWIRPSSSRRRQRRVPINRCEVLARGDLAWACVLILEAVVRGLRLWALGSKGDGAHVAKG
ncbi:unnamed protein product, partial [Urochloa humidicola]